MLRSLARSRALLQISLLLPARVSYCREPLGSRAGQQASKLVVTFVHFDPLFFDKHPILMEPPPPLAASCRLEPQAVAHLLLFTLRPPPQKKKKKTTTNFQLEEELQDDLKWSIEVKKILHSGKSDFQSVELVDSGPFGKVKSERARKK